MESSENIFFMDCIEKLPLKLQKILSVAMKEHYVPIVIEEWGILRDAEVDLHPFTMIAGLEDEILLPSRLTFGFPVRLHLF